MGLLSVGGGVAVDVGALRQVAALVVGGRVELALDVGADVGNRLARKRHRVGPHIGDEADRAFADVNAFIQRLCRAHGALGGHAELAHRLLLQRAGGEGRGGAAGLGALFDADDLGILTLQGGNHSRLGRFVRKAELLDLGALPFAELGGEGLAGLVGVEVQRPVLTALEALDLFFALDDQAQRRALHASRRQPRLDLAPQHRRQIEADQMIERAARLLRIDQAGRDVPRVLHRVLHCRLGDLMEHHALERLFCSGFVAMQDLGKVPGDGLTLAVRVGGEQHIVGTGSCLEDGVDVALVAVDQLVGHGKTLRRVDRAVFAPQVAHVAVGGEHLVAGAEVLGERLALGGRLDDKQCGHAVLAWRVGPAGDVRTDVAVVMRLREGRRGRIGQLAAVVKASAKKRSSGRPAAAKSRRAASTIAGAPQT